MSENFVVSARKYRPGTFADVVGQQHITNTLRNMIRKEKLAHAFLFSGPRGVGKTTCARILAKALNCENLTETGDPCNACKSCEAFQEGKSLNIFELDAASNNGVEDIRGLIEQLRYIPQSGQRSVYIIDEVHMLSKAAFNAFLKTLEEPPPHAIFILATTEKHKILPTILSRCQKFDFRRIGVKDIANHLERISDNEGITYDSEALFLISQKADGALRDALSIYDQMVNSSEGHISLEMVQQNLNVLDASVFFGILQDVLRGEEAAVLQRLDEILRKGFDIGLMVASLLEFWRNLLIAHRQQTLPLLEVPENQHQKFLEMSQDMELSWIYNAFQLTGELEKGIRDTSQPRFHLELLLVKLCHLSEVLETAALPEEPAPKKKAPENGLKEPAPETEDEAEVEEPEGQPATAPEEQIIAAPVEEEAQSPAGGSRKRARSLKVPTSLENIRLETPTEDPASAAAVEPEESAPAGEPIAIDEATFKAVLQRVIKTAENKRPRLFSAFNNAESKFEHNEWLLTVATEGHLAILKEIRQKMVEFFRTETGNPTIVLRLHLDQQAASAEPETASQLHPMEQTFEEMAEEVPELRELQRRFNASLDWNRAK